MFWVSVSSPGGVGEGECAGCWAGSAPLHPPIIPWHPRTRSVDGEGMAEGLVGGPGAEEDGAGLSHARLGGVGAGCPHHHAEPGVGRAGCQGGGNGCHPPPRHPGDSLPALSHVEIQGEAKIAVGGSLIGVRGVPEEPQGGD